MGKKIIFLFGCVFSSLGSYANEIPQQENVKENLQIGRYQMVISDSDRLYLLDTTTGHVWKSATQNNWIVDDCWTPKISTPPLEIQR